MDTITQENISRQTERELTSPLSPKRQRTDCTQDNSGKSSFDFPELLTFWKTTGSSSSTSTLQENAGLVAIAESGDVEDEKPHKQPQDAQFIVIPVTTLTISHTEDAGSSQNGLIAAERCFKRLVGDERPPVTATDELSSYLLDDDDDDDRALAETGSSKDASGDMSSHPDCKLLGKALEDEPPGGRALHAGNNEAGRPMQNSASQNRALTGSSCDEGVRCQSDCSYEEASHDTGFYNTWSQSAEAGESNQEWEEPGFRENILFSDEKEEDNSLMSFTHADSDSFYSNLQPSGNLAHVIKNEYKILELQIYENESVAVCNRETKEQVNENGMSMNSIFSAALCAEGSIGSYYVVSARNIAIESVSLEADDFCGAKGDEAAGKMIAEARSETSDHTTETPVPAQISQGPAEGDNDAGPFSVIDRAIWSETDREAKEKRCNSASAAAGVALFEMETPLCSDVPLSQEVSAPAQNGMKSNHQSGTQQRSDEKEDSWQSCTEPQASSINTEEAHNKAGGDGSCQWKSSPGSRPVEPPPAGDGRQDSHDTVGQEPDQSGRFPVSPDQLETQEVEYLQAEISRMDGETEINEEEIRTGERGKQPENSPDFEQQEKHTEIIYTGDSISDLTEGQISKYEDKLTHADDKCKNNLGLLFDHSYNAVILTTEGTAEEKESKEEASGEESDVHGNSELIVESEVDHQNEDMPEECSEGNTSKSRHSIALASEPEQENKLSCFSEFQHSAEIFTGDNEVDPLAYPVFTFNVRTAGGFDTFERIQLSTDGEDGLSNSPLLTGLLGQLLKSPQQQLPHSMPEAESNEHEEVPEEQEEDEEVPEEQEEDEEVPEEQEEDEEVPEEQEEEEEVSEEQEEEEEEERCGRHTENTAKGFSNSDTRCNEIPNFISAAADDIALGRPQLQPRCESAYKSSERLQDDLNARSASSTVPSLHGRPAPDANDSPKFEKRKLFDMVLKELHLFFDISTSEFTRDGRASSPERRVAVTEALDDTLNHKEHLSSPKRGRYRDASSDDAGEDTGLDMCGGDPVVSCSSGGADGEQEVPLGQETSVCPAERHKEPPEMEQKKKIWSPSFMCQPLLEQLSYRQLEQTRRLTPLKTCSRPIRVGLSKRAKTQRLHRLHPYK